jgi:hypothetical protein
MTCCENVRGFTAGVCLVIAIQGSPLWEITADEPAEIGAAGKSAMLDITVECEYGVDPAPTIEEVGAL